MDHPGQDFQAGIRDGNRSGIGLNGAERVRRDRRPGSGEGVEKSGFPGVGQADDS
jgi:hypothetical protein